VRRNYMLKKTWRRLLVEAKKLQNKLSKDISKDIGVGYETDGGWHDNALYESALSDQALAASRLIQLTQLLEHPILA